MPEAAKPFRLSALAKQLGREQVSGPAGEADPLLRGVAPLEAAGAHELSFARDLRRGEAVAASRAGALILPLGATPDRAALLSPNPGLDFARAVAWALPEAAPPPGIHASAVVDATAVVDPSASVGPGCWVGAGVRIGARTRLVANVSLYDGVEVGEDAWLHAGVVVREDCMLGARVRLQPGVVIGGDGFGYVHDAQGRLERMPQVGRVVIGDDVEIGANSTIDRATLAETHIARGVKIDNLVQVAHNCEIGEDSVVVAQTGLGGSTRVGRRVHLMARVGAAGHLEIGDGAFVGARAGLHKDVEAGARVWGSPQMPERTWHRAMAALARLPKLVRRVRALERRLDRDDSS